MIKNNKKTFLLIVTLLVYTLVLAFSTRLSETFVLPKRFFLYFFGTIALAFWFFNLEPTFVKRLKSPPVFLLGAYLLITAVSVFTGVDVISSMPYMIDLAFNIIVFVLVFTAFNKEQGEKFYHLAVILGVIVAVYSLIQHFGLDFVNWVQVELVKNRSISTLGNPDFLSAFLSMIIPLVLSMVFYEKIKIRSWLWVILAGFLIFVNIFTYTRTGLVSMLGSSVIVVAAVGWNKLKENYKKVIAIILLIALGVGLILILENAGVTNQTLVGRMEAFRNPAERNVSARIYLLKVAMSLIRDNPWLGVGPDNFGKVYFPYKYLEPELMRARKRIPGSSHNIYLDIGVFSGVFALLCFLGFIFYLFYKGLAFFRNHFDTLPEKEEMVIAGYAAGVCAFLIHHLAVFSVLPVDILFWIFSAFCGIYFIRRPVEEEKVTAGFNAVKIVLAVVVIICGGLITCDAGRKVAASYYYSRGSSYRKYFDTAAGDKANIWVFNLASSNMKKAVNLDSKNYEYWLGLGKVHEEFAIVVNNQEYALEAGNLAIENYFNSIRLNPGNPYAYADLGRLYRRFGQPGLAYKYYKAAVETDPYQPVFLTDFATLNEQLGNINQAGLYYKRVLEQYSREDWPYLNIILFYVRTNNNERAMKYLGEYSDFKPDLFKIWDFRSLIVRRKGID
ncbi:MAG: O-antigen ligase family protein [Vulcanimicrobiota bacterium]